MEQVKAARARLLAESCSHLSPRWKAFLHRWRLHRGPVVGDWLKSWDVLRVIDAIVAGVGKDDVIADFGAYGCEVLPALRSLGYRKLHGIDLDNRLSNMPGGDSITYSVGNFLKSPLAPESVAAVTSISVIEHGFDAVALLTELQRVLRPGGLFLASFDYWPEKIDTSDIELFGMDWRIFSRQEIEELSLLAEQYGMRALPGKNLDCERPVIHWGGQAYTFGWMALRKDQ